MRSFIACLTLKLATSVVANPVPENSQLEPISAAVVAANHTLDNRDAGDTHMLEKRMTMAMYYGQNCDVTRGAPYYVDQPNQGELSWVRNAACRSAAYGWGMNSMRAYVPGTCRVVTFSGYQCNGQLLNWIFDGDGEYCYSGLPQFMSFLEWC